MLKSTPAPLLGNKEPSYSVSVPILVDSKKDHSVFAMTRCAYFTIEYDPVEVAEEADLGELWSLELSGTRVPLVLQSLVGVITGPIDGGDIFSSYKQIDDTLDAIEEHPDLMVGSGDFWLPNWLLEKCHKDGEVYRVGPRLFRLAWQSDNGSLSQDSFEKMCQKLAGEVRHRADEEEAFAAWQQADIAGAREYHQANLQRALQYESESRRED